MFRLYGNVRISWLDDTSCFVALHNRENATGLLKTIGKHEGVTMTSYADFKSKQNVSIRLIEDGFGIMLNQRTLLARVPVVTQIDGVAFKTLEC